ncbi:MAG: dTDP-glucose 4,6-dehydratase [Planctomycetota bacterium]
MTFRRVLVTGGCGFIGSHFVRTLLRSGGETEVTNLDLLTYSGNPENLRDLEKHPRYKFVKGDIARSGDVELAFRGGLDAVVHFAAESHVDRSILDPSPFLRTNVLGTELLLDASVRHRVRRFLHVSTDEVYGTLGPEGRFTEESPLAPNSPYAASKAGSDLLVRAAWKTHGLHATVTRSSNNFGPNQFPEKLLPLAITNAIDGLKIPVYGDGAQVRDWIYVEDHCEALAAVLERGEAGEIYNVGGGNERENLSLLDAVLRALGKGKELLEHVPDRPGHDRRYALDSTKMRRTLGWKPALPFEERLAQTVDWYRRNEAWWRPLKKKPEYTEHARAWYGEKLAAPGGAP